MFAEQRTNRVPFFRRASTSKQDSSNNKQVDALHDQKLVLCSSQQHYKTVRASITSVCVVIEPQAKRFAGVCGGDVDQVIVGRVRQAPTDKQERRIDVETCEKAKLSFLLSCFYVGARQYDGAVYQRISTLCLRAVLKSHFMDQRQWDITNDVDFARANNALDGILTKHKRAGKLGLCHTSLS